MKLFYYITLSLSFLFFVQEMTAQDDQPVRRTRTRDTESAEKKDGMPELTERARIKNSLQAGGHSNAVWLREIYRSIDLEQESNSALYYPVQPIGNRMNLFTLIFRLLCDGKIKAYNYEDGREVFTDREVLKIKEMLDKYEIPYTTQGSGDNVRYTVEDIDIPSTEVLRYMIKEAFYVDEATGTFNSQVIALCPLLIRENYYSGATDSDPLFWVPYEEIRPYISRELIMTSNYNNALTYTMDDYFMKRMYDGEIIKTTNMMNQTLEQQVSQQMARMAEEQAKLLAEQGLDGEMADMEEADALAMVATPPVEAAATLNTDSVPVKEAKVLTQEDYLKMAQDSIEIQLKEFNDGLWVFNDSIAKLQAEPKKKGKDKEKKSKSSSKEKNSKEKKSKDKGSDKASPTRSVRRGK